MIILVISTIIAQALTQGGVLHLKRVGLFPTNIFNSKPGGEFCIRHPQVSWLYLPCFKDHAWSWHIQQIPVNGNYQLTLLGHKLIVKEVQKHAQVNRPKRRILEAFCTIAKRVKVFFTGFDLNNMGCFCSVKRLVKGSFS